MNLAMLGINFRSAPVEVRERLSFATPQIPALLARFGERIPDLERVLICTCNRTELYVGGAGPLPSEEALIRVLLEGQGEVDAAALAAAIYSKRASAAAEHLLAVAASLDSMVVGETEVLGQVKQAYATASEMGAVGSVLHPVFQTAFRVAKHVHAETSISQGRVSVSSLAVEFTERVFDNLPAKTVMIVGAGETAELALRSLVDRGVRDVIVFNRSPERAQNLAAQYAGKAVPFDLMTDYLARADLVIASTSSPYPLIWAADIKRGMAERRGRPMLLIDLSVPRNIDPLVTEVENVYLYHLDDLQKVAAENLAGRGESVAQAWKLVHEGLRELAASFETGDLRSLFKDFDQSTNEMREEAVRRCLARPALAALPEAGRAEIAEMADKLMRKLLAGPREALKTAARNGRWEEYERVTRDLFRLNRKPGDPT
ncbi:MAG: glutamyl-tRNA reductase [Lentisphaerae bacterium]|nr:glutamyl-tRNA reductase [Lentisphaerota bacterium]